ncbi:MAG: WxPxxD family membrane protein [Lachnospiraceae bacterium]|nr:WxPxxD family membrane protein [Lachnospiraceae bacterium]
MNVRILKGLPFLIALFIVDWCSSNIPLLKFHQNGLNSGLNPQKELLFTIIYTNSGFQSIVEYTLIYIIPYLVFLNYISGRTSIAEFIRMPSRTYHLRHQLRNITISSAVFTFVHEFIAWIGTAVILPVSLLKANRWFEASLFHFLSIFLFYIQVGLFCKILAQLSVGKIQLLYTFLFYAGMFYLWRLSILDWTPVKDTALLEGIMTRTLSSFEIVLRFIRELSFIILLYLLNGQLFERSDLIPYESK